MAIVDRGWWARREAELERVKRSAGLFLLVMLVNLELGKPKPVGEPDLEINILVF